MKRIFLLISLMPALVFAQAKQKIKPPKIAIPNNELIITGKITGLAEGTSVALLNAQTGAVEAETTVKNKQFILKEKLPSPDFKLLTINKQPPYATLFLDNSPITITGTKETLDKVSVTGSATHQDFSNFNNLIQPYQNVFNENTPYDSLSWANAATISYHFATTHTNSFITPFVIYRYYQASDDISNADILFNKLSKSVKASTMGSAVAQVIAEAKNNLPNTALPNFVQTDTAGKPIALSSLRGKFVLIDFWASWCRPCRQENPNVVLAYNKFKGKNFTILGVSLDKSKEAWVEAIAMDKLTWTHVSDLQGWNNAVAIQNQIQSIPQNFLIDPEGKIIGKNLRGASLERKLQKVLK